MSEETIKAALQLGIALGKEEKGVPPAKAKQDDEEETYQEKITAVFNAASAFTRGLEKLRDLKGSTFTFKKETVKENDAVDVCEIIDFETNILSEENRWGEKEPVRASISIPREGYKGGCFGGPSRGVLTVTIGYADREYLDVTSPQAVEKALTRIAQQAAKRGLVP